MITIRKATKVDQKEIAYCIAEAFEKDFSPLCKTTQTVANALQGGIHVERFFVAEETEGNIVGALAIADCGGPSISVDARACRKQFGFIKGFIAVKVMREEFEQLLECPHTTGYIQLVCVLKSFQAQGIAKQMLKYAIKNSPYTQYELDVTNINQNAIQCYKKIGFSEYKREKVKYAKQKGFEEKIYMKYKDI